MNKVTIIGITDSQEQWFPPAIDNVIANGRVFSGGRRHREIMSSRLPAGAVWIDITVPLSNVFQRYAEHEEVIVFASGDPLFYGFAQTVQRLLPSCRIIVHPAFNSLQSLAHRVMLPYQDMHAVSLTGRPWHHFDEALIRGEQLIGVLTDRRNTPHAIIARMLRYGYDNYSAIIGYNIGNEATEQIITLDHVSQLSAVSLPTDTLCCMILRRTHHRPRPFGIPETDFHLLNGRTKMITKMPIRLLTLSMLDLHNRHTLWDIGFCTGSVSIEAKLQFPHLHITAFEVRPEGEQLMQQNSEKFGTPGIETVIGDFTQVDISTYPRPDAIFIGGHGGRLPEIMHRAYDALLPEGVIVMNSVSQDSHDAFVHTANSLGMTISSETLITIDDHNPITILKATK